MYNYVIDIDKADTICALATPIGKGAIGVIRISGDNAITHTQKLFSKSITNVSSHTIHLGTISFQDQLIDEVLVSVFKTPHSYTGENSIEISCHGSSYIIQQIIDALLKNGCRYAKPGEFTLRAFLNGKLDLSQAEAVGDLIASNSSTSHQLALNQMRGGFSAKIKQLRQELIHLTSLIELELDFSEEDVAFADRNQLLSLLAQIEKEASSLAHSFSLGNVLKQGVPIAIIGKPNVGKSTLLNALLNEEKAIVSEIAGTTRDVIEDTITIEGIVFRFIDTAGLRDDSSDTIENIGIERTYKKIQEAHLILYLFDSSTTSIKEVEAEIMTLQQINPNLTGVFILIANKIDKQTSPHVETSSIYQTISISAKHHLHIEEVKKALTSLVTAHHSYTDQAIVSNLRHVEAINHTLSSIAHIKEGLDRQIPSDLLTVDIRMALHHLGSITGEITTDDILGNIFGNFCIGK